MAVFRVEKNKNYTVMSNYHLRDKNLSLKSKGLLSLMLSLPETWDYTLAGLTYISKDGLSCIRSAVSELEEYGYLRRRRLRNDKGQLTETEYTILEQPDGAIGDQSESRANNGSIPQAALVNQDEASDNSRTEHSQPEMTWDGTHQEPICGFPTLDNPTLVKPILEKPALENRMQISKERPITEKSITDSSIHPSINPDPHPSGKQRPVDKIDKIEAYREIIKENIEYEFIQDRYDKERLDELVEIMVGAVCSKRETLWVAGDEIPTDVVRSRLLKMNSTHVEYVFECLQRNTTKVYNIKSYLLTTLYNATLTIGSYYTAEVSHDLYGN